MIDTAYPRDLIGYGENPPHAAWPGGARIAVQMVLNYEEGAENTVLHGDAGAETFLSDMIFPGPTPGARNMSMESIYEYGSRAGVWRLLRLFERYRTPVTVFGVAMAMERNPAAVEAMLKAGHEIASHGWRWINYQDIPETIEREHLERAIEVHTRLTGERPLGWYTGRTSPNTRRLVAAEGGFSLRRRRLFRRPAVLVAGGGPSPPGRALHAGGQRHAVFRDRPEHGRAVLQLSEGRLRRPLCGGRDGAKMMSVGLHCRIVGRPGKMAGLERFIRYALGHKDVWFARRIDIARHWRDRFPQD